MTYYTEAFAILIGTCAVLTFWFKDIKSKSSTSPGRLTQEYKCFSINYLTVYYLVMAGDWLQGPYIYAVYKSHGFDLNQMAILFITGFISSGVFGIVVGPTADRYGRKKSCLVFTLLYSLFCLIVRSPNFNILLIGRIISGISTSLLFSVFEAWMVSEHFSRGFPPPLLSDTFSNATFGNGLVAIFSGLLANLLVKNYGVTTPFMASIVFFAVAAVVISSTWKENYGNSRVLAVGAVQSLYEASMYTFVFFWGPFLEHYHKPANEDLPFGMIFSSFMVAIMIGSLVYGQLSGPYNISLSTIAKATFLIASISLFLPLIIKSEISLFAFFTLFELTCGIYFPVIGTLRAKVIPENIRATVSNLFRVPLNIGVVFLIVTDISISTKCLMCSALLFVAFLWSFRLPGV
ncbi:3803_t:CDS:2 [Entrophospora sp. SA101]|nr:14716_t:CDS:2 [Entrophospora sp. SA101]CAJ0826770.1 3803_t:CDS:2 [Entrophospora sp. SA101]